MRNCGLACVCFWIRFRRNYSSSESSVDLTPAVGLAEWISLSSLTIFICRILGTTTLAAITLLALKSRKLPLHPRARTAVIALATMGWMQPTLGIATLLLYVPTWLAAMHQSGALITLSSALWLSYELKLLKALKMMPK